METSELLMSKLADFYRGVTFDKADESKNEFPNSIPVLRAGNIQLELDTENDLIHIPSTIPSKEQIFRKGDIAICISSGSSHLVGKTAPLRTDFKGTIGGFCGIIRPKNELYGKFLKVWLKGPEFKAFRNADASGSNIQNLQFSKLPKIKIQIPKDLKKLENFLDETSEKLTSVEQMRQAALKQKEAVEALQDALLREVFPFKEGDELPKGWKWEKLDKIFEEVKNQVQPYEDEFKTLPFVGLENVVSHTREYTDEEYNPPASTCFKFDETNILYGKLRPYLNKVYLPTVKGKSSMELIPLKTKNKYSREFLAAVLQSEAVIGDTVKFSTGGRMPRADLKKLKKLEVAIPSDISICNDLGISVSKKIKEFIDLNKKTLTQLEAIEALPAAILREVFEFNKN